MNTQREPSTIVRTPDRNQGCLDTINLSINLKEQRRILMPILILAALFVILWLGSKFIKWLFFDTASETASGVKDFVKGFKKK